MEETIKQLVELGEEIYPELIAIYNRTQNRMSVDIKQKAKQFQDLRVRAGLLGRNDSSWSCNDCVFSTISISIIPFQESPKFKELLAEYNGLQTPLIGTDYDITDAFDIPTESIKTDTEKDKQPAKKRAVKNKKLL